MSLRTFQATANQTPDPSFGGDIAVTTPTNTGHATSLVQDLGVGAQQNASWRCTAFPAVTQQITAITLRFDWQIVSGGGTTDITLGGTAAADASFQVQLSTDGGATFPTTALTRSGSISGNNSFDLTESGSVSLGISPTPSLGQVQVRDRLHANATQSGAGVAQASVNANISNVRLEVTVIDPQMIIVM